MNALLAFLPILATLVLMMVFNWPARWCLLISWVMAAVFGFVIWDVDIVSLIGSSLYGALGSLDVIIIISGAILLMNTLKASALPPLLTADL
jgi:lactate permease